ncbi:MAG TPA: glycosyltransferase family 9 protein [Isosphaeraceae bacterium]|jgi:lipopolysaccharide heptosyltransferase I|nr:glycosyltransferase family 9 protein [Isosphaeraceae bacterium]
MAETDVDLKTLKPGRVCILKPSSLGDIVHALPVLAALRERWPEAKMAWVVNKGLRALLDGHPDLDEVIPFDRARAGAGGFGRFLVELRRRRFDVTIDLQGLLRSAIMTAATGATVRVGSSRAREGAARFGFYTHRVDHPPLSEVHAVDRLLAIAAAFGAAVDRPRFALPIADEDRRWAREALEGQLGPRLVLNPGARWATKRWPPEHFAEVGRRAALTRGASLVVVGAAEDRALVDALKARLGLLPCVDLCGRTSLMRLAAVAAESAVVLSNDTGPLHLAAAAGARVVGLYTCTSPVETGPYGPRAVAVATRVACAASYLGKCNRLDCMSELTADRVWEAVRGQLDAA